MRLPYYRSRLFWCGIVVLVSLLVAWWDSSRYRTSFDCRWGTETRHRGFGITSENGEVSVWAGRPYEGMWSESWTGIRYSRTLHTPIVASSELIPPISISLQADGRLDLEFAHWAMVGLCMFVGISDFGWWQFQKRRQGRHKANATLDGPT